MLMDVRCSAVSSVKVVLTFDDGQVKENLVANGDLIDVTYNGNGLRRRIVGKVMNISTIGSDPKGWYIIVDGSDDFESMQARFSPMNILDLEIIRKAGSVTVVQTELGHHSIPYIRIVKGRLQFSKDGINWHPINIDRRDIIEDQEGTVPINNKINNDIDSEDGIEDAVY